MSITPIHDPITASFLDPFSEQTSILELTMKEAPCHIQVTYNPHLPKPSSFHQFVGKFVLAGSFRTSQSSLKLRERIAKLLLEGKYEDWKIKREPFNIDGNYIDTILIGSPATLFNRVQKRWMIFSLGCADFYEDLLLEPNFRYLLRSLQTNCLIVNYPNTAQSKGPRNKELAIRAYQVALHVLENIIQANQIILWGFSLGGGTQAEALKNHVFNANIRYVKIDMQTFSSLSTEATSLCHLGIGKAIVNSGWEMSPLSTARILTIPQIVLNRANNLGQAISDGVIPATASLIFALQQQPLPPNLEIMPLKSKHGKTLTTSEIDRIAPRILLRLN
jgi:hypothetical protein